MLLDTIYLMFDFRYFLSDTCKMMFQKDQRWESGSVYSIYEALGLVKI